MSSRIVLLFCHNHLMCIAYVIAALEFVLHRSREIVLRTLYAHACHGIRAASGTGLSTSGNQQLLVTLSA